MVKLVKAGGRYLKGAALGKLGFCTQWAVSPHHHKGPEWLEVVEVPLHFKKLPSAFKNKRIVQVSDFHCSRTVSVKYLKACIERINNLEPDIVALTGDYITYDYYGRFRKKVIELLEQIKAKHGVYACLGNHDYGSHSKNKHSETVAEKMIKELKENGVHVLRNESTAIELNGHKLHFVGLGDIWLNDCEPLKAFKHLGHDDAVIVLSHNPDSVHLFDEHHADAVMSGHTHGVSLGVTVEKGKRKVALHNYPKGMFKVGTKKLYVNRGLGRHGKMFYNSRPEITVFSLS